MAESKAELTTDIKRSRAALGTFVSVSVTSVICESVPELIDSAITHAFGDLARTEKIFSRFDRDSRLSALNRKILQTKSLSGALEGAPSSPIPERSVASLSKISEWATDISPVLGDLCRLAFSIAEASDYGFDPFSPEGRLDLNGIAKGFAVDRIMALLEDEHPECQITVNAGGDLRTNFRDDSTVAMLKLGDFDTPVARSIRLPRNALAVSSPIVSVSDVRSRTDYRRRKRRDGLTETTTVAASADTCAVADALTKVLLFANPSLLERVASAYDAVLLVFNDQGQLTEHYGSL